jgi:hypothetical protein
LEIKRQIIQGTSSLRLRRKAIEQSLTLKNVLKTAQAMETANEHTSEMEKQQSNAVGKHNRTKFTKSKKDPNQRREPHKTRGGLCGGNYPHRGKMSCPREKMSQVLKNESFL